MYHVTVIRGENEYYYTCEDCGWKDSTTFQMIMSKKDGDSMRLSLYRNDSIEVKEVTK